jgi:hypothetical protein
MPIKVLAFAGSPRRHGNSEALLDWVLGGMSTNKDVIIEKVALTDANINPMGVASQVKALIDRAQVFRSRKYVLKRPIVPPDRKSKRLGVFLASAGQKWDYVFDAAIPSVKCFYHVIDIRDADISYLMINGVDEKGAIEHHPTAKTEAEKLGKTVIAELRKRLAL